MIDDQLFICGTGRSGTTVFTRLLGKHPAIWAYRWESALFSGMPGLAELVLNDFEPGEVARFRKVVLGRLFKRSVRGEYDAGLFEIIELPRLTRKVDQFCAAVAEPVPLEAKLSACAALGNAVFRPKAREKGASMWCEKTPRNLIYADVIARIYPRAKFINVVRDGRNVLASMLERKFWPMARSSRYPQTAGFTGPVEFEAALGYWSTLLDIGRLHAAELGPERWLDVRFEDLSADLGGTMARVFEFVGLPSDAPVLESLHTVFKPTEAKNERWRGDLDENQIARMHEVCQANLLHYGYRD